MRDQAQLLPGTLDLLILRAVSLELLHTGMASRCASRRFQERLLRSSRAHCIRDCFDWFVRDS
jgi:hypothetical protein